MTSMSISLSLTAKSRLFYLPRNFKVNAPTISIRKQPFFRLPLSSSLPRISVLRDGNSRVWFRVGAGVIRASAGGINVPSTLKPGSVVESDKLPSDVRNRVMEAIDAFGGRVTIGDVASKAGLKLNEAQKALQALAADTDGFLEVSDEGDVLYVFPKDYRSKLAAKSLRMKIEPWAEKAKSAAEYLIRVSFGTTLVASIVLVFTAIFAIMASGGSDDDNRRRRRSFDSGVNFYFYPTDLFWYWDRDYYRRRPKQGNSEGMNFIESVFSFVFGDGDPNQGIEEERWKLIGEHITSNGGVVTAEELAPYLDVQTKDEGDESYILPVLLRFDGQPDVDEEGNILYRFPSLQRTASSTRTGRKEYVGIRWSNSEGKVKKFFEEKKWRFSKTSLAERAMVIGLGTLNLFGVLVLTSMLMEMSAKPSGLISFVAGFLPVLQVYAGSFFVIPLVRWFFISKTNAEIEKRNRARKQRARALELPDPSLRRKLLNARDMAQRTVIGKERIVYSTEKDFDEQDYEAREWEKRFRELERSD
uniref:Iron-sulfur cluster biosynthesis family protein n=1 Tax=Opuntia streptacantha TaxID=393608 RepID=A0A7C9DD18_OPUST